jgi:hypothetical protein
VARARIALALRSAVAAAALALACAPFPAGAQPKPPAPAPAPPPVPAPAPPPPAPDTAARHGAAIARLSEAVARDLAARFPRAFVAGSPLVSDTPAPRGGELVARIAAQIAGRLGPGARAGAEPAALALARQEARGSGALIHFTVEIAAGKLRVAADAYPVPRTVWARIRDPEPGSTAHAFAETPLDAEVRTFLAPIPLVAASIERAKNFEGDVVALACGELVQDGGLALVSVSRRRVTVLRLRGGKVLPLFSKSWTELSPVAPAPLREPIGFAAVVPTSGDAAGPAFVDVGLTDRARSVRLDGTLRLLAGFSGVAVPPGTPCLRVGGLALIDPFAPCTRGDPPPGAAGVGGQVDAFASAHLVTPSGQPTSVWAERAHGLLEVRDDQGNRLSVEGAGAQIALGDRDQDGDPEILSSLDTLNALDDAVVVRSWSRDPAAPPAARLKEILRIPAPAGVHALAVCPPDGPGPAPFAVATSDEIWVVR